MAVRVTSSTFIFDEKSKFGKKIYHFQQKKVIIINEQIYNFNLFLKKVIVEQQMNNRLRTLKFEQIITLNYLYKTNYQACFIAISE